MQNAAKDLFKEYFAGMTVKCHLTWYTSWLTLVTPQCAKSACVPQIDFGGTFLGSHPVQSAGSVCAQTEHAHSYLDIFLDAPANEATKASAH